MDFQEILSSIGQVCMRIDIFRLCCVLTQHLKLSSAAAEFACMEETGRELALIVEALTHNVEYQEGFLQQLGEDHQAQSMRERQLQMLVIVMHKELHKMKLEMLSIRDLVTQLPKFSGRNIELAGRYVKKIFQDQEKSFSGKVNEIWKTNSKLSLRVRMLETENAELDEKLKDTIETASVLKRESAATREKFETVQDTISQIVPILLKGITVLGQDLSLAKKAVTSNKEEYASRISSLDDLLQTMSKQGSDLKHKNMVC